MNLWKNIVKYNSMFPEENVYKERMLSFLVNCPKPFNRRTTEGHFTASAFLLNMDKTKFLLIHHRKLRKWLQPGGHCDGDNNVLAVAIREATEESGIVSIAPISKEIYDIDIHWVPNNFKEPGHYHYDIRFLLQAVESDIFIKNDESYEVKWFDLYSCGVEEITFENSIKRMVEKFKLEKY